jgi:hypothetical protein
MFTFLGKTLSLISYFRLRIISSADYRETETESRQVRVRQNLSLRTHNPPRNPQNTNSIVFSRLNLLAILNDALGRKTAIREPLLRCESGIANISAYPLSVSTAGGEGIYRQGHKVTRRKPLPSKPFVILRALRSG